MMDTIEQALPSLTSKDWLVLLFGFFGGGLAGASFTQFIGWLRRPKLRLHFSRNVKGCIVDPPGYVLGPDETPILARLRLRPTRCIGQRSPKILVDST
jgi:hypothetical protein